MHLTENDYIKTRMANLSTSLISTALNAIYPPVCIRCGVSVDTPNSLCTHCWSSIHWLPAQGCDICHFPFEYLPEGEMHCANCIAKRPLYDRARSVFLYNEHSAPLVTQFKYGDRTQLAKTLSLWMCNSGKELLAEANYLCPVPLHWQRFMHRKYNQAALLAHHISKQTRLPVHYQLLLKQTNSVPQASLNKQARLKNTKGVFSVNPKYQSIIKNKNILLIDDVTTTGATINECAKILKKSGAAQVNVLTLAKTLEH